MHTVGVTGGSGFLGGYVCEELQQRGYHPVVFDPHGRTSVAGVEVVMGDVRDATAVTEFAAHVDGLIHLAAVLGTAETIDNPRPAAETNLIGSLNVFEAAVQYHLPVAYVAVGNARMAWGTYVLTKTCAEDFARMFAEYRNLRINCVRVMNAYGPRQVACTPFGPGKVRKITPAFTLRALCGMPIEVYGDGSQVSDMVWVGDAATALVRALQEAAVGNVFPVTAEVGPAESATVRQVAESIRDEAAAITGQRVEIVNIPMRAGENQHGLIPNGSADVLAEHVVKTASEWGQVAEWRARQLVKPIHNRVAADATTLDLVGMTTADLMPLDVGIERTVNWFAANEDITWWRP